MIVPTRTALAQAMDWLPSVLVSPEAWARITALAAHLPDVFSDTALECRLDRSERVDILVALIASDSGHRALLADRSRLKPAASAGLARVVEFCEAWANGTALRPDIPLLWLEYDMNLAAAASWQPFPFPCVRRDLLGDVGPPSGSSVLPRETVARAIGLLTGRPISSPVASTLARCFDALPPTGHLLHVAPLVSRGLDAVRVVFDIPVPSLPDYLTRVGWPGAVGPVRDILGGFYEPHEHVAYHLDVGEEVRPTLGLEQERSNGWEAILDRLVGWGACAIEKREVLPTWPGRDWVTLPHHKFPCAFERVLLVKLVHEPERALSAKAYLGFRHRFAMFPPSM